MIYIYIYIYNIYIHIYIYTYIYILCMLYIIYIIYYTLCIIYEYMYVCNWQITVKYWQKRHFKTACISSYLFEDFFNCTSLHFFSHRKYKCTLWGDSYRRTPLLMCIFKVLREVIPSDCRVSTEKSKTYKTKGMEQNNFLNLFFLIDSE